MTHHHHAPFRPQEPGKRALSAAERAGGARSAIGAKRNRSPGGPARVDERRSHDMINAFDPARSAPCRKRIAPDRAGTARRSGPAYRLFYEKPVHFVRGEASISMTRRARPILTPITTSPASGHCQPRVVEAIIAPGGDPQHPYALSDRRYRGFRRAIARNAASADRPCHVHLHGSEANDLALRIARAIRGPKA